MNVMLMVESIRIMAYMQGEWENVEKVSRCMVLMIGDIIAVFINW